MLAAGKAIFFDGVTSAKRPVLIELAPDVLVIRDEEHRDVLARWRYDQLDHVAAPAGLLRLGRDRRSDTRAPRGARCGARNRDRRGIRAGRPLRRARAARPVEGGRLERRCRRRAGACRRLRRAGARRQDRTAGAAARGALDRRCGRRAGAQDARHGQRQPPVRVRRAAPARGRPRGARQSSSATSRGPPRCRSRWTPRSSGAARRTRWRCPAGASMSSRG